MQYNYQVSSVFLPHFRTINCKESHGSQKKHHINCGFDLFADLKTSVAKMCKCF